MDSDEQTIGFEKTDSAESSMFKEAEKQDTSSKIEQERIDALAAKIGTWPSEPLRIREEHVEELLLWCVNQRASDTTIQTDKRIYIEVDGVLFPVTKRKLDSADLTNMLTRIYGPEVLAKLASGVDLDLSYEIRPERNIRWRFRVNITAILSHGRDSVQMTLRTLPNMPPTFKDLNIEQQIIENWSPRQGLILVTGPTGSGKTTLLAAGCRMLIERSQGCGKMITYEAPIEYVYDAITSNRSLVSQSEIPRHLASFAAGIRNAMRRKPSIILVGESRDRETVSAAIEAGQTGHLVFSTVHTIGVAATVRRMISVFDPSERTERAYALMETLRMIITQTLAPRVGGGRIGLREYLVFDDRVRDTLLDTPVEHWATQTQRLLARHGQSMEQSANKAFKAGLIDRRSYLLIVKGFTVEDEEIKKEAIEIERGKI
ncbi:MAG: Flp pilus assembly complex ATPase component TadA [Alphaproteobacteria bacterium]|nr:Flp pilus assembly complex ATPase component TadA [Alphaproteobacteria bacterium]